MALGGAERERGAGLTERHAQRRRALARLGLPRAEAVEWEDRVGRGERDGHHLDSSQMLRRTGGLENLLRLGEGERLHVRSAKLQESRRYTFFSRTARPILHLPKHLRRRNLWRCRTGLSCLARQFVGEDEYRHPPACIVGGPSRVTLNRTVSPPLLSVEAAVATADLFSFTQKTCQRCR
jgi:hypothetical protein